MAIDRNPQPGRIILKESMLRDGLVGAMGHITRIASKSGRVYFRPYHIDGTINESDSEEYVQKFSYICDTEEEATALAAYNAKCIKELEEMRRRHSDGLRGLIASLNGSAESALK